MRASIATAQHIEARFVLVGIDVAARESFVKRAFGLAGTTRASRRRVFRTAQTMRTRNTAQIDTIMTQPHHKPSAPHIIENTSSRVISPRYEARD